MLTLRMQIGGKLQVNFRKTFLSFHNFHSKSLVGLGNLHEMHILFLTWRNVLPHKRLYLHPGKRLGENNGANKSLPKLRSPAWGEGQGLKSLLDRGSVNGTNQKERFLFSSVFSLQTWDVSRISDERGLSAGPPVHSAQGHFPGNRTCGRGGGEGKLIIIIITNTNGEQFIMEPFSTAIVSEQRVVQPDIIMLPGLWERAG